MTQRLIPCYILFLFFVSVLSLEGKESPSDRNVEIIPVQTIETSKGNVVVTTTQLGEVRDSLVPFLLSISIEKPSTISVSSDLSAGRYGDFLLELDSKESQVIDDSRDLFVQNWRLYPQRFGENTLPPIPYRLNNTQEGGEKFEETFLVPQMTFNIEQRNEAVGSVDKIVPDLITVSSFPIFWTIFFVCVLALLTFLTTRLIRRKIEPAELNVFREPPLERALRRLDELKQSPVYLENAPQFYIEIDGILRDYLSDEFSLNAEKQTVQETLRAIDSFQPLPLDEIKSPETTIASENVAPLETDVHDSDWRPILSEQRRISLGFKTLKDRQIRDDLERALRSLDYIKFAKQVTTFNDASQTYSRVRATIENASSQFHQALQDFRTRSVLVSPETSSDR